MAKRVYISCYSCDYATIYSNGSEKTVHCNKSDRDLRLKQGMSYPEWCERRKKRTLDGRL